MKTLVIALLVLGAGSIRANEKPNILLILADDLGYADVGFNGAKDIPTPELDQLAHGGTIFSSAYVAHSFCGPSRAALMTGRYPQTIGSHFNLPSWEQNAYRDQGVSLDETMMSTMLQRAGYTTGLMGKWHLGEQPAYHPNRRGFDEFWGFLGGGKLYFGPYTEQTGKVWSYKTYPEHNGEQVTHLTQHDYMTEVLTDHGIRFMKEAGGKKQPFFLFMSYNAPHTMLEARQADIDKFKQVTDEKRRIYSAMVHALDREIGRLLDALKQTGAYDNTLIVFLSDNGGRIDQGASNTPLKGSKNTSREGGFRVPMFMHWPNRIPAGTTFDYTVSALDLYPTFAHLAGAALPKGKKLDGLDIWEHVTAGTNPRKGKMIFTMRYDPAVSSIEVGARRDQWKIFRKGRLPWQLYNLDQDIGETTDLSGKYPERLQDMIRETEQWTHTHNEPQWFNSLKDGKAWVENNMPRYDQLFDTK